MEDQDFADLTRAQESRVSTVVRNAIKISIYDAISPPSFPAQGSRGCAKEQTTFLTVYVQGDGVKGEASSSARKECSKRCAALSALLVDSLELKKHSF